MKLTRCGMFGLLLVGHVSGCAPEGDTDVSAVAGGQVDVDTPQVGWVTVRTTYGESYKCSGVLIRPDVVVTAGHCTMYWWSGILYGLVMGHVNFGPSVAEVSDTLRVMRAKGHPAGSFPDNDIAVLRLESPVLPDDAPPLAIGTPTLGAGKRLVGFGLGENNSYGVRKSAAMEVVALTTEKPGVFLARGIDGSGCRGDSGGALVDDATGAVIGIVSGGTKCEPGNDIMFQSLEHHSNFIACALGEPDCDPAADDSPWFEAVQCVTNGGCRVQRHSSHDAAPSVPEGTVLPVWLRSRKTFFVSYPGPLSGWAADHVWSGFMPVSTDERIPPPDPGVNDQGVACAAPTGCAIYLGSGLAGPMVRARSVECGHRLPVYASDRISRVVSVPLPDEPDVVERTVINSEWQTISRSAGTYDVRPAACDAAPMSAPSEGEGR